MPRRALEIIDEQPRRSDQDLLVYWLRVDGSRHAFADELCQLRAARALVPLVPKDGFIYPNAVLSDLSRLCDDNRAKFGEFLREIAPPLIIVVISSTELGVSQVSSPATLPEWIPFCGGRTVWVNIESLNRIATGNLNSQEVCIPHVTESLYRLDCAMVRRMRQVSVRDHNTSSALIDRLCRKDERLQLEPFLAACEAHLKSVVVPSGYRPSVRTGNSLLARLAGQVSRSSPDELGLTARALSSALALPDDRVAYESILTVLFRPTNPVTGSERASRALLVVLYAAYQLSTASAHAAEYPMFPLALLETISRDLQSALSAAIHEIEMPA